ncbi:MAG TPA: hypothetical protein ENH01_00560 [Nitrospirae bacterium]|nr:hypothetical protein [Nitrospirota bacterium]
MIKAGIKIGPYNWVMRLIESGAERCEVWFLINKESSYADMFQFLDRKQIRTGLNFRGVIENNRLADPVCRDETVRSRSILLIQKCIDIAGRNGFSYVNILPGNTLSRKFNPEDQDSGNANNLKMYYRDLKRVFRESALLLHEYGQNKNVNVLWETPPVTAPADSNKKAGDCSGPGFIPELNSFTLEEAAKKDGILITNNIDHIMAESRGNSLREMIDYLFDRTRKLAQHTRLLHINKAIRENNGANGRNGAANAKSGIETIPTKSQLLRLLELFKDINGLWAINDQANKQIQDFVAFRELLMSAGKNEFSRLSVSRVREYNEQ